MIRVLHIITGLSVGGAETMLAKLIGAMNKDHFGNEVVSLTDFGPIAECMRDTGINVSALHIPRLAGISGLVGKIRSTRADIVQTWMYHADLLGGIVARMLTDRPVIWNIRNNELPGGAGSLPTRFTMRACALLSDCVPTRIVTNSNMAKDVHVREGYRDTKFRIIPNGFDTRRFSPDSEQRASIRKQLDISDNDFLVGFFARLDPVKNHTGFIDSCASILTEVPQLRILMCGRGVDEKNVPLLRQLEAAGLRSHAILLGEQPDMPRYYAAIDTLCLASKSEAFPNVVGEAMACGIPCVVTDVGDCRDVVGKAGLVVPAENEIALGAALKALAAMPVVQRQAMGRFGRERIVSVYSLDQIVRQYERLYYSVVNT
ncbi:glycosyltransferase [Sphingosinicella microcystinivorans]|uniref:Glycosyltransferase involved in cell wall biosynthesis n=2 Tax=Sphingosinicella microcystinivorans TaxID=335406 RepID=A0ABX9T0E9_SPHMI|nr:glycosyltransferase [Sphingosinicella microcystinivorans]RKS90883.1 glycosyltransferase involved in cell wall biosynthesis [Sphingosinicella microcystinivorans]